ncbi:MAG: alpha/beta fold hydrolase [Erysipelotrichaceae bacterium]|nr:alpha/beta fold hydrolase [Erysipelotrichaceae bacterium]
MMKEIFIDSKRGSKIPVSLYEGDGSEGILLMAHSFRSQKEEDGRYVWLGERLAEAGFICMAPDFAGNGKSEEPFQNYSLKSCLEDLECCYDYLKREYVFDPQKAALLGYSMGGRIISLFLARHKEFHKLVFWASVLRKFKEDDRFLEQDLRKLKSQTLEKGYCDFYDIFAEETIKMSKQFIDDLLKEDALKPLRSFQGEALILQGNKDTTIEVENGRWIYDVLQKAKKRSLVLIDGADHGFGLWDGRTADNEELLQRTLDFLCPGSGSYDPAWDH